MVRVSVIIPAYNRAHCIERALQSVVDQTLEDFELLVCDDASTDATRDIVRSWQEKDPRIKLLCLSENQGPGGARNVGLREAKGEYIAFLDSDDEWLPEKLARQVECLNGEPPEVGICFCGATIIKNENTNKPIAYIPEKSWEQDTFRKFVMKRMSFLTPAILVRRSCLEKTGLMVPEMRRNEDIEFLLRLFCYYGLVVIPEPYLTIHLIVSDERKFYDELKLALPHHLKHRELIRKRAGYWPAKYYTSMRYTNLLQAAIRERRWSEAWHELCSRVRELPLFHPEEVVLILKSFVYLARKS